MGRGAANLPLKVNAGGTDIEFGGLAVAGGGTGATTIAAGVVISNGTSPFTNKTNPAGAFLGDSDIQNITGAKTWFNQIFRLRNPANTFNLTFQNPAITADKEYRFNGSYDYMIFKDGSTYYAKNGVTKAIDFSGSAFEVVLQAAVDARTNSGGTYLFSPHLFVFNAPVVLPQGDNTNNNQYTFIGQTPTALVGAGGTVFQTANNSTNLSNRCVVECIPSIGSAKRACLRAYGITIYHPWYATFNCGGIDLAADANTRFGNVWLDNLNFWYCNRGIHLAGYFYHAVIRNCNFTDVDPNYVGLYDLKMELGGYPDKPDFCLVDNIHTSHTAGSGVGTGSLTNAFFLEGNYNTFSNFKLDGWTYSNCPVRVQNANGNDFINWISTDLNGANGTATSTLYLTAGAGTCKGNRFQSFRLAAYPPSGTRRTVLIDDANVTNNRIELMHWGSNDIIIDESAGSQNIFVLMPGFHTGFTQAKAVILNLQASSQVIDNRAAANRSGVSTQSGNASTVAFNIAHNCYTTPLTYSVIPQTGDALGPPVVTATSTNLVLTYPIAPPSGTNNLTWVWNASVY